jgi:hypothetical protein
MPRKPYFQAAISINAPVNDLGSKRRMIQLAVSGSLVTTIKKKKIVEKLIYFIIDFIKIILFSFLKLSSMLIRPG